MGFLRCKINKKCDKLFSNNVKLKDKCYEG